jgi:GNAT superfamily N-acetyltransferase
MDIWLRRYAKRSQRDSLTRVFVLVDVGDGKLPILGYFAISMCSVAVTSLTEADKAHLPRYPVPAVLMTRLAVATAAQGRGLGGALLYKAAEKALLANELVAARLFVVDALDPRAADFYQRHGFVASPEDPLRLYIGLDRLRTNLP